MAAKANRKRGKGKPSQRRKPPARRASGPGRGRASAGAAVESDRDPLWDALRQGARNVAGVRYQLAVTAHLLAESRAGGLPFVELIPEGYEDIDCLDRDSVLWLVQAKEVGAGSGRFTASAVAEVISHAAASARKPSRIVAVTDGQLGRQVIESGWKRSISETPGYDVQSTIDALVARGHSSEEASELVERAHVVRLPWNTAPLTVISIAESYKVVPAVATIVTSRLVEDLAEVAADQRHTSAERPARRTPTDLDALVARVMSVVDLDGLDSAIRSGVCEIADYVSKPAIEQHEFLLGVDAIPAHVGANFDIIRPTTTRAVQVALEETRYALVAGPSGSGKSAQMWRSARDVAPGARVLRVTRLETDADVLELTRHVELLEPTETSAVIVCCDDLGRPHTARWPTAARRLLEQPAVFLIGAVRQEDFTAELLRYGGDLVELALDDRTAMDIADQLAYAGVDLVLEVDEAIGKADGQLMEYVALLTTGHRLRAVLASQVETLLRADHAGAAAARLVCAAHVLGVSIDAEALAAALDVSQLELTVALSRLQDEHIITSDDHTGWRGLHQRRSETLTELLHQTPPPTLNGTLETVLYAVGLRGLGWSLRRIVELFPHLPPHHAGAVEQAAQGCQTADEAAVLFEGLERADHSVTASTYIPILERHRRGRVPLLDFAMLVCGDKFGGVRFGTGGDSLIDRMGENIHRCAEELPERFAEYASTAASAIGAETLTELAVHATLEDAVRLLEAAALYVSLQDDELSRIAEAFVWPGGVQLDLPVRQLHGRLLAACYVASRGPESFARAFGTVSERFQRAAESHPNVVTADLLEGDPVHGRLELLAAPEEMDDTSRFPWDLEPRSDGGDATNRNAVNLATFIGECCPEFDVVEATTILADGSPLRIGDFEPGHKRLARNARPPREVVRVNVGVQAAISRQAAAYSWTELVRLRTRAAALLASLTREAPRRLSDTDNSRRREDWLSALSEVGQLMGSMPRPPATSDLDIGVAAASWDAERDEDQLSRALRSALTVLEMLVPEPPGKFVPAGAGDQARQAASKVREALDGTTALTTASERAAFALIADDLDLLRDLLVALAFDGELSRRIRGSPNDLPSVVRQLVHVTADRQLAEERERLEAQLADVPDARVLQIQDEDAFVTSIAGHQWLIVVPPASWEAIAVVAAQQERVVDVPVSVVCEWGGVLLPIAARFTTSFGAGLLPLGPDAIERFATAIDKEVVSGPAVEVVGEVVSELALASWEHARASLRPPAWADAGGDPNVHLDQATRLITDAGPARGVVEPLQELAGRVRSEIDGADGLVPLAAELAGRAIFDSSDIDDSHSLAIVTQAVLAALDVELQRVGDAAFVANDRVLRDDEPGKR